MLLALLLLPCVLAWRQGYRPRDLLPGWRLGSRSALTLAVVAALGLVLNLRHVGGIRQALDGGGLALVPTLILAALVPLLGAALPEEFVFRALLHSRLEAVAGRVLAWLVAALLFTAWHLPTRYLLAGGVEGQAGDLGSVLLGTGLPVFIVGLVFGWAWDRWRSLPHLVLAHWSIDLLPSISSFLGIAF